MLTTRIRCTLTLGCICFLVACDSGDTRPRSGSAAGSTTSSSGMGSSAASSGSSSGEGGMNTGGMGVSSSSSTGGGGSSGASTSSSGSLPGQCNDGMQNGSETGIDCGGPACLGCAGDMCAMGAQCVSQSCVNDKCALPSCSDKVKNGTETGVDCGGPDCSNCADNVPCLVPEDCINGICNQGLCVPPSCSDGVSNGDESGIDCGGMICGKCPPGADCGTGNDCISGNCSMGKCNCPAGMITASTATNVTYCIDQTEVTNKAYVLFVNTPNLPPQDPFCSWNTTYVPSGGFAPSPGADYYPVANVDWCDAFAYCKAVGKHLCGGVGAKSVDYNAYADPAASIWHNACSGQGNSIYPYGNQYTSMTCVGTTATDTTALYTPLGMLIKHPCAGNFPNIYHMSGNVAEWEDSCAANTGSNDNCRIRGGSFGSTEPGLACAADAAVPRSTTGAQIGFRCCQ